MTQSVTNLYNLALGACGSRGSVASVSETTIEATLCNVWYAPVRAQVFRSAHWNSLREHTRLALLVERDLDEDWVSTDPEPGFVYAYSAPAYMAAARYLTTYERFRVGTYNNARAIFTDVEDAILCFTEDKTNVSVWDASLYLAVAYALAAHICPKLTGKAQRSDSLLQKANIIITQARVDSANEKQENFDVLPDWIQARGYRGGTSIDRYVAPYGPQLSLMGAPVV